MLLVGHKCKGVHSSPDKCRLATVEVRGPNDEFSKQTVKDTSSNSLKNARMST